MSEEDKKLYLEFAKNIAREAGVLMHKFYRSENEINFKSDFSPVTAADKAINQLLIERVQAAFSTHGVIGEEASLPAKSPNVWVCDPIDGTVQFIQHIPLSMFSLALVIDGEVFVAVAFNPWTNDMYNALKGGGAYRNDEQIHVSHRTWETGVLLAGSTKSRGSLEPVDDPEVRAKLFAENKHFTNVAGTVFKGCLIAEGSVDGRTFMHDGAHDIAAIKLLIEEAGGKVTDLDGNQQRYDQPINGAILSNGLIHSDLLKLVQESKQYADFRH